MLKQINRFLAVVLIVMLGLLYFGGGRVTENQDETEPAEVEPVAETELKRVKLTAKAAERLGIATEEVRWAQSSPSKASLKAVPYSSLIYDLNGETWVYVNPESLNFLRHPVTVDYIEAETVYLLEGPDVETQVVTVGAAELYGAETGVGK